MNILVLSPVAPPVGGIATWTEQVEAARDEFPEVAIEILDTNVRWRSLNDASFFTRVFGGVLHGLRVFGNLLTCIRRKRPDVVHICSAAEYGIARDALYLLVLRLCGAKTVLHLHRGKRPDFPELVQKFNFESAFLALAVRLASVTIVLNVGAREALFRYAPGRVELIPNMVRLPFATRDEVSRARSAGSDRRVLFVGHVIERKGAGDLVEAAARLNASGTGLRLRIVGPCSSDMERRLRDIALRVAGSFEWLEFCGTLGSDAVGMELTGAAVFCLPSYAEGLPYVVLEAMSRGAAVISTNVGGIPEALANDCGVIIEPGDVMSLQHALTDLLNNAALREELGARAFERCQTTYGTRIVFEQLIRVWGRAAGGTESRFALE